MFFFITEYVSEAPYEAVDDQSGVGVYNLPFKEQCSFSFCCHFSCIKASQKVAEF